MVKPWTSINFFSVLVVMCGLFFTAIFHLGLYVPIWVSVGIFVMTSFTLVYFFKKDYLGVLPLVMWLVYALPFIHLIGYLTYDFGKEGEEGLQRFWLMFPNEYMMNQTIIEIMAMMGAVGALGFLGGALLSVKIGGRRKVDLHNIPAQSTLPLHWFYFLLGMALLVYIARAPKQTFLSTAYEDQTYITQSWNFSSIWFASCAIVLMCFVDALFEKVRSIRRLKLISTIMTALYIVLWLNMARGDREALPMILAMLLIYYFWGKQLIARKKDFSKASSKFKKVFLFMVPVLALSLIVSKFRSQTAGMDLGGVWQEGMDMLADGRLGWLSIISGTWSGVLLTPLSIAGDYYYGDLPLEWGQSYLNLFLSAPPGFVADAFGYTRPLDTVFVERGLHNAGGDLAWAMTWGIGGIHAVVMPFFDFRIWGVWGVIGTWSYFFSRIEQMPVGLGRIFFMGVVVTAAPHWLWYGEKSIINAVIYWALLYGLHNVLSGRKIGIQ